MPYYEPVAQYHVDSDIDLDLADDDDDEDEELNSEDLFNMDMAMDDEEVDFFGRREASGISADTTSSAVGFRRKLKWNLTNPLPTGPNHLRRKTGRRRVRRLKRSRHRLRYRPFLPARLPRPPVRL